MFEGDLFIVAIWAAVLSWAGMLSWFDVRHRTLPNWLTLPAAAVTWVALLAAGEGVALAGAAAWGGLYLCIGWRAGGIGGGDVKLALSIGPACWWAAGPAGAAAGIVFSSGLSVAVACACRCRGVPHGPSMIAAGLAVVLAGLW